MLDVRSDIVLIGLPLNMDASRSLNFYAHVALRHQCGLSDHKNICVDLTLENDFRFCGK